MKDGDYLVMIVPSLWMKPDKDGLYDTICQYKLHKIRCFNNTETNALFHKKAQTPTCMFFLEKAPTDWTVSLYNSHIDSYKSYQFFKSEPLPLCGSTIVSRLRMYAYMYGIIPIVKTNMPRKHITVVDDEDNEHSYKCIHTCLLKNKTTPSLVYKYSNEPCAYYGREKLVLAHKMYGFPYYDAKGEYGISNRDNYVLCGKYTPMQFKILQKFLSSKLALYMYETTRYRMKYLEKYVFSFIPDITHVPCTYSLDSDDSELYEVFGLNSEEIQLVETFHKKEYCSFLNKN